MKKKSLLLGLTAVIIISALAVGGTLAYFTSADRADNTFTIGSVAIKLFEHDVDKVTDRIGLSAWVTKPYEGTETEVNAITYEGVYPGAVLPKDPTIRNTGKNSAYVRMKVTISNASAWKSKIAAGTDLTTIFGGYVNANWNRAAITEDTAKDTITYVYNYNGILAAGGTTGALFTSVTIPTAFNNDEMSAIGGKEGQFTMNITAEAIQAEGFTTASDAFSALNGQLTPLPPS